MGDRMTVAEAAALLGYAASSVRTLYRAGELTGERIGARVLLLDRASVEAFAGRKRKPGRPKGWRAQTDTPQPDQQP